MDHQILNSNGSMCFYVNVTTSNGLWVGENPLGESMPLFILQLAVTIFITRILSLLLKPFCQPRFVTDLLGGLMIGSSSLGRTDSFLPQMFPLKSIMLVETVAYLALVYYSFLVGLKTDLTAALQTSKRSLSIVAAAVVVPIVVGIGLFFMLNPNPELRHSSGSLVWAVALSVTGFPVVNQIIGDLKLLHTDIGRMALSTCVVNDLFSWVLLTVLVPIRVDLAALPKVILTTIALILACIYGLRPMVSNIIRHTSKGDHYNKYYLCSFLIALALFALISEACGVTSIVGAFLFGLIMPNGTLKDEITEKFNDFVSATLLPLFFAICGIRIKIHSIHDWGIAIVIVILSCSIKIASTLAVSLFHNLTPKEGFSLGVILNTKGVLAMIVLNMGWDIDILNDQDYAVMVVAVFVMTGLVPLVLRQMYKPTKRLMHYQRRSILEAKPEAELRILTCVYNANNVTGLLDLLDASADSKQSPISIFALQLVELKGRASATLIVHNTSKSRGSMRRSVDSTSDHIISAFEAFEMIHSTVTVQPFTAVSPYSTMHEDICGLAEDKNVAFMILPFHKQIVDDGNFEETNTSIRGVFLSVLANAPCSVGIFVDRGFKGAIETQMEFDPEGRRNACMIFIGGPDDREALAYAWRMSGQNRYNLTVVRFVPNDDLDEFQDVPINDLPEASAPGLLMASSFVDRQKNLDDDYINEFRVKSSHDEYVNYTEIKAGDEEAVVEELKMLGSEYGLYIVGKGEGVVSPLTAALLDWCEFPELGAIGDVLVCSSFCGSSVLVIQQYAGSEDMVGVLESSWEESVEEHGSQRVATWQSPRRSGMWNSNRYDSHGRDDDVFK